MGPLVCQGLFEVLYKHDLVESSQHYHPILHIKKAIIRELNSVSRAGFKPHLMTPAVFSVTLLCLCCQLPGVHEGRNFFFSLSSSSYFCIYQVQCLTRSRFLYIYVEWLTDSLCSLRSLPNSHGDGEREGITDACGFSPQAPIGGCFLLKMSLSAWASVSATWLCQ